MSGTNDFLPFASGTSPNVLAQTSYAALSARTGGFVAGTAFSQQLNKVWRQGSNMASAIGAFVASQNYDALDNGDVATLSSRFAAALVACTKAANYAVAGGTANALTATLTPAPAALVAGLTVWLDITATNTAAATLNLNGLGAVPIVRQSGTALAAGDLAPPSIVPMIYDGAAWYAIGASASVPGTRGIVSYATAGTSPWIVPAGVTLIECIVIGGGGGGGGVWTSAGSSASGGAGGGYAQGIYPVVSGATLSVTVGAAGAGGTPANNGGNGGTSSVGALISATGGKGGTGANGGAAVQNLGGGTGSGSQITIPGGASASGVNIAGQLVGSPGGSAYGSAVVGGLAVGLGLGASAPGGGGGGASGSAAQTGAPGAPGLVIIRY